MTKGTNPVGGQGVWETWVGKSEAGQWARPIVRYWGDLFLGFVLLVIWFPIKAAPAGSPVLFWVLIYLDFEQWFSNRG